MTKPVFLALLACAGLGFAAGRSDKTAATSAQVYANQSSGEQRSSPGPATEGQPVESPEEPEPTVQWVTEREAKASGKPILYLATKTIGCAPCKRLKSHMENPIVAEAMSHFACVLIEDPPANHPWMKYHHVTSFPAIIFANGSEYIVQRNAPADVPTLLQWLHFGEKAMNGEKPPTIIKDGAKTSISTRPTLAPRRPHLSAVKPSVERSVVVRRGRSPGLWARITFRPGR